MAHTKHTAARLLILFGFLFLKTSGSCGQTYQNIYVQSGINFGFQQLVLNKFAYIFGNVTEFLQGYPLNLNYPDVLQIEALNEMTNQSQTLASFSVNHLNFPSMGIDEAQSNFQLLQPTQQIKIYLSNIYFNATFDTVLAFNPALFPRTPELSSPLWLAIQNLTFTMESSFYVHPETNALAIKMEKLVLQVQEDSLSYGCDESNLLGLANCLVLDYFADQYLATLNEALSQVTLYLNFGLNTVLYAFQAQLYAIQLQDVNDIFLYMGFYHPSQVKQCNPLVYSEFMSFMAFGKFYPNRYYSEFTLNDTVNSEDFVPLQYDGGSGDDFELQLFISEFTINEFYYAFFDWWNFTVYIPNWDFTTNDVSLVLKGFNESFGSDVPVKAAISCTNQSRFKVANGNIYFAPDYYEYKIYPLEIGLEDPMVIIGFTLENYIFSVEVSDYLFRYIFLDYNLTSLSLVYSSNSSFLFNSSLYLELFSSEGFKSWLFSQLNYYGAQGINIDFGWIVGEQYAAFVQQTITDFQIHLKDEYFQVTSGFSIQNTSLYENLALEFLTYFTNNSNFDLLLNLITTDATLFHISEENTDQERYKKKLEYTPFGLRDVGLWLGERIASVAESLVEGARDIGNIGWDLLFLEQPPRKSNRNV